ncbi:MAG: PD-(D/E)XK nuclease-like domain-containing protein [Caulobacteraceae bacterium]
MQAFKYNGKQIAKPGIYHDVPIDAYHSGHLCVGKSVSTTSLKRVLRSPAHFWARSVWNPNHEPEDRSEALDEGAAAHCRALEPEKFVAGFVVSEFDDFRTKEARTWRDAQRLDGKIVLTAEQDAKILRMAERLKRDQTALALFRDGLPELTLAAKDEARRCATSWRTSGPTTCSPWCRRPGWRGRGLLRGWGDGGSRGNQGS